MFLRHRERLGHSYYAVVESYRGGEGPRQRAVINLGRLDNLTPSRARRLERKVASLRQPRLLQVFRSLLAEKGFSSLPSLPPRPPALTAPTAPDYWVRLLPGLDEAQQRWLAGAMALQEGRGGLARVARLTGLSLPTVRAGMQEVRERKTLTTEEGVRRKGAGRKPVEMTDPKALRALENLLQDATAGNPQNPLRWTHKSTRTLAEELTRQGHPIGPDTVARLLRKLDYSLQVNSKQKEGRSPVERDSQFVQINETVKAFQAQGNPVLSIDCKKKEKVGLFKSPGLSYRPKGQPLEVNVYDFPSLSQGPAIPYGIYDVGKNAGYVNVGMNHDTPEFAVESLRWWWRMYGRHRYPQATGLLLCADGGGSNGSRTRAWKLHLKELATEIGFPITVCHYPPGSSKWNKIEHRLFCHITSNWQGTPPETYETVVNLIANTTTKAGLRVKARLDRRSYPLKERVPDAVMAKLKVQRGAVNPQWNYTIKPNRARQSTLPLHGTS